MIDRLKYTMRAMQMISRSQEVTANNLANINTPGFKRDKLFFQAYSALINDQPVKDPSPYQRLNLEAGSLEPTGNEFDFAISGDGFFQVNYEGQTMLSRNGRFMLDGDGFLRDENGGFVQGGSGDIYLPQLLDSNLLQNSQIKFEVASDGAVRINDEVVDKIQLFRVENLENLERRTNSYLAVKEGFEAELDMESRLNQGFYESGNVNPLAEMISMTTDMRLFESQQRNLRTSDELLGRVTNNLSRF
jgi:flagellar basal-body rod protein FlgF/flagellar basal-body rod protein FlgG